MGIRTELARRGWSARAGKRYPVCWFLRHRSMRDGKARLFPPDGMARLRPSREEMRLGGASPSRVASEEVELAGRHRPRHPPIGGRAALDPGRAADRAPARPGGSFRRGRGLPRGGRRPAGCGRPGRHRRALPRHRPAVEGAGQHAAAGGGRRSAAAVRVARGQLRRDRPRPGAEARPAQAGHPGEPGPAARGRRDGRQRQGQDRRARRAGRPGRGDRLRGRHPHRAGRRERNSE